MTKAATTALAPKTVGDTDVQLKADTPPPKPLSSLSDKELDELASHVPHVKAWLKAVEDLLKLRIDNGVELNNASLVPTQPRRYWKPDIDVMATLRKFSKLDVVAPRVPLTPAQAEKTLGKKLFAEKLSEFTVRESSGMKLTYKHDENEEE